MFINFIELRDLVTIGDNPDEHRPSRIVFQKALVLLFVVNKELKLSILFR